MNDDQLKAEIDSLKSELAKLKGDSESDKKKDFWIKVISSVILPLAITFSGYLFSQAIKSQELKQSQAHDSLDSMQYQQQLQISVQNQRLETYKFITPLLDIIANAPDPQKRSYATKLILAIMPSEGPQLLSVAIASDPANTKQYQATLDSTQYLLVSKLFADDASTRISSANDIMVNWYKSASIVPLIVKYATDHAGNANGLYNAVVVLQNMHGSVLKINKKTIQDFLQQVIKLPGIPKTASNAQALNTALNKM